MFTRKSTLVKKTGPDRVGRYEFLKQLIVEFGTTKSLEAKKQVLANLANFSYDPVNFEFLKQLHAIDLFLAQLSEDNEDLLHFGLSALCNLSPDEECKDYIIKLNGIKLISDRLFHKNEEIALNAITTLYYLIYPSNKHLLTREILDKVQFFESHQNPRYKNLGTIFMEESKND
ncbi:Armadillo repeat-containing protein 7-like Protein [Tribolium castaneum]|uniref:Armadillo repeat-containing protein 7-like Protein n=1 Tax=Tribolium castaneum TaxID=7070 RepID=D6WNT4_TRICA|nr:Armadillo repeat-containing protein 7-like Protein [Tribolium castaneum]